MTRLAIFRCISLFGGLLALSACASNGPTSRATAAQRTACSQRADQVYLQQNRGAIYENDMYVSSTRDAPFSGSGLPGNPSAGLSAQFARDKIQDSCLDGTGTPPSAVTDKAAPAPAAKP
jgi:hypothetical protein